MTDAMSRARRAMAHTTASRGYSVWASLPGFAERIRLVSDVAAAPQRESEASDPALWTVHQGDARDVAVLLERAARAAGHAHGPLLQTTITSPPYANLVDYGSDHQIGFGQSYEDYLKSCRSVFETIHRWTLETGSMWIVADSLIESGAASGSAARLVPLPFDLAAEAESVGWTLREVVVWRKDRTRPWSHRGKLRNGFEYVLFFVKSSDFTFNIDALRDTAGLKSWWIKYPERHNPWGMTPDNVWEIPIPVQGSWNNSAFRHACPFPPELVRRMIALSSNAGDVVFDPFAGSGTVVSGAIQEGRLGLGLELNPEYVALFHKNSSNEARPNPEAKPVGFMTQRLLELRVLKYPKELAKQVLRAGFTTSQVHAVLMDVVSINYKPARTNYADIFCSVIVADDLSEIEVARLAKLLGEVTSKAPLSKYGLTVQWILLPLAKVSEKRHNDEVSIYTGGRTWYAATRLSGDELEQWIRDMGTPTVMPIISPLHVQQSLEESS